jgi:hypothetical protein
VRTGREQRNAERLQIRRLDGLDQPQAEVRAHARAQHLGRPQARRALDRDHLTHTEGRCAAQDRADVARVLEAVEDDYLRERVADVRDVGRRILLTAAARRQHDCDHCRCKRGSWLERVPDGCDPRRGAGIVLLAAGRPGVCKVHEVLTVHSAPTMVTVIISADFEDTITARDVERIVLAIETDVAAQFPIVARVFVRPRDSKVEALDG